MRGKFDLTHYFKIVVDLQNPRRKEYIERRNQMFEMRKSGKTYAEIGKRFGISRQRVFAILKGGEE